MLSYGKHYSRSFTSVFCICAVGRKLSPNTVFWTLVLKQQAFEGWSCLILTFPSAALLFCRWYSAATWRPYLGCPCKGGLGCWTPKAGWQKAGHQLLSCPYSLLRSVVMTTWNWSYCPFHFSSQRLIYSMSSRAIYSVCVCVLVAQLCLTLCNPIDCSPPGSSIHGDSPVKNTEVGFHALLQGIFPTQGSNPGLLHCRWILYHLSHQGSPRILV